MRKIILEEWISIDGYATDAKGGVDFFANPSADINNYSDQDQLHLLDSVDTMLLGRKTYELFVNFWPEATTDKEIIADKLNGMRKLVFTNTLKEAPWGKWPAAEIVNGDAVQAIKNIKAEKGKDMILWGSLTLAEGLMKEKLIDEFRLRICPVLNGAGKRLFEKNIDAADLKLIEQRKYEPGLIFARYGKKEG